jgi:multiple sugar transport system ATP-binding protein
VALIELRKLAKRFPRGTVALHELDLTVNAGELLVILGPSGSGKTTLLRLVAGLEMPSSGSVWIDGRDVKGVPPHERNVGMVFQHPALYPHLTVFENLRFALRGRGLARQQVRTKVNTVAGVLALDSLLGRRSNALSGGERQRVAIGRALVREPRVILLDEPFSSLDTPLRADLREQVVKLQRRFKTTLVHVTHDQAEALLMADRVAIFDQGRLLQCDGARQVYDRPANRLVATFVGNPPMNIIPCQLEGAGDVVRIHAAGLDRSLEGTIALQLLPEFRDGAPRQLDLGLRPEAVAVHEPAGPSNLRAGSPHWPGIVRRVEFNGPDVLVTLTVGLQRLVARVPVSHPIRPDQRVEVLPDLSRAVWFEPETGAAIRSS